MPSRNKSLVFLTGYMGAGKSTIGKRLGFALGYKHIDTDHDIEKKLKRTMSKIYEELGEKYFRQQEERLIEVLAQKNRLIVSTGGGTLTRLETFYTAQRAGLLIYLKAPVEVLYERAVYSQKDRPLLNQDNSEEKFKNRFAKREQYYNRADFVIETHEREPNQVVEIIKSWLLEQQEG
jgi:shikimate kinase